MALIDRLFERRGSEQSTLENPASWLLEALGAGRPSATGITVTENRALESPAYFSGVAAVSETIGSLTRGVFRRLPGGGKEPDPAHPLHDVVHLQPNPETTAMLWAEMKQANLLLSGNAYSEIVRDAGGRVRELWPLSPSRVRPERDARGELVYQVSVPGGLSASGTPIRRAGEDTLQRDQVLHIRGLSLDGVTGLHRVKLHREAIGLSLALEEYGARFFANNATPSGALEAPGKLGQKGRANLRDSFEEQHKGLSKAHRLAILEEGIKFHEISVANEKAQFLQSRQYQVGDSARIVRIPGLLIGHDDKTSTYASAEQFFLAYVVHTVRPWVVRWDQALTLALLTAQERRTWFVEHNIDSLLRGDALTRAQALEIQFRNGAILLDEWRGLENRNPLPEGAGKKPYIMANMVPLDRAGVAQVTPPPARATEPGTGGDRGRRARLITHAAAERIVRRETAAVREKATQLAGDAARWRTWVEEFYARHVDLVADTLQLEPALARDYAAGHARTLLAGGLGVLERWEAEAADQLAALALEDDATEPARRT